MMAGKPKTPATRSAAQQFADSSSTQPSKPPQGGAAKQTQTQQALAGGVQFSQNGVIQSGNTVGTANGHAGTLPQHRPQPQAFTGWGQQQSQLPTTAYTAAGFVPAGSGYGGLDGLDGLGLGGWASQQHTGMARTSSGGQGPPGLAQMGQFTGNYSGFFGTGTAQGPPGLPAAGQGYALWSAPTDAWTPSATASLPGSSAWAATPNAVSQDANGRVKDGTTSRSPSPYDVEITGGYTGAVTVGSAGGRKTSASLTTQPSASGPQGLYNMWNAVGLPPPSSASRVNEHTAAPLGEDDERMREVAKRMGIEEMVGASSNARLADSSREGPAAKDSSAAVKRPPPGLGPVSSGPPPGLAVPAKDASTAEERGKVAVAGLVGEIGEGIDFSDEEEPQQDSGHDAVNGDTTLEEPERTKGRTPSPKAPQIAEKTADKVVEKTSGGPTPEPASDDKPAAATAKKPMSWANVAKTAATPPPARVEAKPSWSAVATRGGSASAPATSSSAVTAVGTAPNVQGGKPIVGEQMSLVPKGRALDAKDARRKVQELFAARGINPTKFDSKATNARYFVIKSYTEDDVHKSLKYSIWSSTDMGNRRLNGAFSELPVGGSVYLFYSVNASGHFCGVARMETKVDWDTSSTVWQQDKWKGVFGVRWLFVKDVPNGVLRHLRVAANENKPVTNSRDTQELPPDVGREMLRIFCDYRIQTCILDDWGHYEGREVEMKKDDKDALQKDSKEGAASALAGGGSA